MLYEWVEFAAQSLDNLAVGVMITFIVVGGVLALIRFVKKKDNAYARYRVVLARTIQVGLELLVAADIIRTVSIPLTALNLALLSGLVVVRTFLGWTLTVEIEGRWPWQGNKETLPDRSQAARATVV
jgi:uncharacterized membrane protein